MNYSSVYGNAAMPVESLPVTRHFLSVVKGAPVLPSSLGTVGKLGPVATGPLLKRADIDRHVVMTITRADGSRDVIQHKVTQRRQACPTCHLEHRGEC